MRQTFFRNSKNSPVIIRMDRPFRKEGAQHGCHSYVGIPQRVSPTAHEKQPQCHMDCHVRSVSNVSGISGADASVKQPANPQHLQIATPCHNHRQADNGSDEARLERAFAGGNAGGVIRIQLHAEELVHDAVEQQKGVAISGAGETKTDDHACPGFDVAARLRHSFHVDIGVIGKERLSFTWKRLRISKRSLPSA